MTQQQPMKMAAAEALYDTDRRPRPSRCSRSGRWTGRKEVWSVRVPGVLSFLATGSFDGARRGHQRPADSSRWRSSAPATTCRSIPMTYWTFRLMIGFGAARRADRAGGPVVHPAQGGRTGARGGSGWPRSARLALPFAANSVGWIFTEMGRQPWVVFGVLRTAARGVPERRHRLGADLADRVHAALRRARGRRGRPDGPLREGGPRHHPSSATPPRRHRRAPADGRARTERTRDHGTHRRLVRPHRGALDRLLRPGGLRLRGRHAPARSSAAPTPTAGVAINTIGPVWDGNEVWLLVAGGATFAAFPEWYATLFSGFYLALLLILVALIVRGVAFEFRGKIDSDAVAAHAGTSPSSSGRRVPALLWGVAFANIVAGVPLDANHEFTGTLFTLLNPYALLGGLADADALRLPRRGLPRAEDDRTGAGARDHAGPAGGHRGDRARRPCSWCGPSSPTASSGRWCRRWSLRAHWSRPCSPAVAAARAGRSRSRPWRSSR